MLVLTLTMVSRFPPFCVRLPLCCMLIAQSHGITLLWEVSLVSLLTECCCHASLPSTLPDATTTGDGTSLSMPAAACPAAPLAGMVLPEHDTVAASAEPAVPAEPTALADSEDEPYHEADSTLNWAALATQPNILFTASTMACFTLNPGPTHWEAVKHLQLLIVVAQANCHTKQCTHQKPQGQVPPVVT